MQYNLAAVNTSRPYRHFAFGACEALSSTAINLTWVHLQFDLNLSYDGGV